MPAIKSCLWFHADAVSFVVPCESQADVDRYSDALVRGGEEGQCGWLEDCFGVSWQVVPNELGALLGDPHPAKAGRVMQAMLGMKKLNVSAFRRARRRGGAHAVTREELIEAITHLTFSAGRPNAVSAVAVAKEVLKQD